MPTKKKTPAKKTPVKKVKNVKTTVKQKQRVSVTVNVNSNNKRKIVATKPRQLPSLNPIIQVPVPYNNSQFFQTHGQEPILRHEPVRVPIEPLEPIRTITSGGMLPPVSAPAPDPMLSARPSTSTTLKFGLPDIRKFAVDVLGYSKSKSLGITIGDKADFISEYGSQIQEYLNPL